MDTEVQVSLVIIVVPLYERARCEASGEISSKTGCCLSGNKTAVADGNVVVGHFGSNGKIFVDAKYKEFESGKIDES